MNVIIIWFLYSMCIIQASTQWLRKEFELIWDGSAADRERDVQPKVKAGPWKQHGAIEEWSWGGWVLFLSCWDLATVLVRLSFSNKQLHEEITTDYVQISK